jgi:excisionase family DNA binding protein
MSARRSALSAASVATPKPNPDPHFLTTPNTNLGAYLVVTDQHAVKPEYISRKVAATLLSVSEQTILKLNKSGTLPAYYVGRAVRIKVSDLDAVMKPVVKGRVK